MTHPIFGKQSRWIICDLLLLCTCLLFTIQGAGQGDLLIMPKRVLFEGTKRYEDLTVANIGKDSATYLISFIQIRMKEDGNFEKIVAPDSAQFFSDKNMRFFPRSVTLGPNEAQTIKIQVTKKDQLSPGEYRSHLYFRAVPTELPLGEKPVTDSSISIHLVPVFGISIPVILRIGINDTQLSISEATFQMLHDTIPAVNVKFNRQGNMSVYGNISVDYISTLGKVTPVAKMNGVAVYTPNSTRNVQLGLSKVPGVDYRSGRLHIAYKDQSLKGLTLAEQDITLR